MKNKNGYTVIELLVIMGILGVGTIIAILTMYPKFDDKTEEAYETGISLILKKAEDYGETVKEEIKDSSNGITISVAKLAEKGYLLTDENGNYKDPRNYKDVLNDLKINIKYDENKDEIKAEMVS